jgi:hypothetical protein
MNLSDLFAQTINAQAAARQNQSQVNIIISEAKLANKKLCSVMECDGFLALDNIASDRKQHFSSIWKKEGGMVECPLNFCPARAYKQIRQHSLQYFIEQDFVTAHNIMCNNPSWVNMPDTAIQVDSVKQAIINAILSIGRLVIRKETPKVWMSHKHTDDPNIIIVSSSTSHEFDLELAVQCGKQVIIIINRAKVPM